MKFSRWNYGTLNAALMARDDWGKTPDRVIAQEVGCSDSAIHRFRKTHSIPGPEEIGAPSFLVDRLFKEAGWL